MTSAVGYAVPFNRFPGVVSRTKQAVRAPHRLEPPARPTLMRRTAWIWLAGCIAWLFDAGLSLHYHATARAELNFLIAMLFGFAYAFYASQKR